MSKKNMDYLRKKSNIDEVLKAASKKVDRMERRALERAKNKKRASGGRDDQKRASGGRDDQKRASSGGRNDQKRAAGGRANQKKKLPRDFLDSFRDELDARRERL